MKLLVTGAGGMTGAEVVRQARARGWECAAFDRADLDITDASAVEAAVTSEKPDAIVNAAAWTAVDAAEGAPAEVMSVNSAGAGNVAQSASRHDAAMIHISTDYVFDGTATRAYEPNDGVGPVNVYGESKLAGEMAVRDECPRHVIIRTSWIYSHEGKNFVRTMLRAASERDELRIVNDQHGCPTAAADLALALLCVAGTMAGDVAVTGTFHFSNSGITTWYEFAKAIFEIRGGIAPRITPVSSSQFPTTARRPAWSVLDTASFEHVFGLTPRPWRAALADSMARMS